MGIERDVKQRVKLIINIKLEVGGGIERFQGVSSALFPVFERSPITIFVHSDCCDPPILLVLLSESPYIVLESSLYYRPKFCDAPLAKTRWLTALITLLSIILAQGSNLQQSSTRLVYLLREDHVAPGEFLDALNTVRTHTGTTVNISITFVTYDATPFLLHV